ncbi:DUF4249 domain-containing protein [Flavivirga eckloniae]|uniref:DUF4249 domain-containing protein n=1 Tax=Flavivirga eckloniae TaxID=1803846 RepID=A0A2K9PSC2_9FLAO|nr:DUF4249 domain-containing protein [Flavivirga eckloniae]AUP79972.1 DUF4249 domain-containing protein [Flavivirga eckloniae]
MRLNKHIFLLVLVVNFSCTEPFNLVTESFEDTLVVEATITDELKTQKIKISRTYRLENDTPVLEEKAKVKIVDSNNNEYDFRYEGSGIYNSIQEFQAVEGVSYKLFITASDGKEYISDEESLAPKAEMDLYVEAINANGTTGAQVFVNTNDNLGDANYFRYEYEETYKVVAPLFTTNNIIPVNVVYTEYDIHFDTLDVLRSRDKQVCYSTKYSNQILITSVNGLSEDKISRFPIRFLSSETAFLRERYSILVRQYVQSANANNFYKILKELGSDGSLLIDNQPGFIRGNIFSKENRKEKIVGFFDVSSVTSKRIYFNYKDFDFDYPFYFFRCDEITLNYGKMEERFRMFKWLNSPSAYMYVSGGKFSPRFVSSKCVDCTTFSSNIKPEFWED